MVLEYREVILTVVFSPKGRKVDTASSDGTVNIWPVNPLYDALRRKPRVLSLEEKRRYNILTLGDR
jgi:hypothetical protein